MSKTRPTPPRNPHARALRSPATNACTPIAVDTRPKLVRPRKGKGSYKRNHATDDNSKSCIEAL